MTPDPQLLTKQVLGELTITGSTIPVRFNLQRGKIARIWGFNYGIEAMEEADITYQLFVRKTPNAERSQTPQDILWQWMFALRTNGINFAGEVVSDSVMFPKPYRTSGITVQITSDANTARRGSLIIYYDVDDVAKGELIQRWEKSRQKKYDRRMLAP